MVCGWSCVLGWLQRFQGQRKMGRILALWVMDDGCVSSCWMMKRGFVWHGFQWQGFGLSTYTYMPYIYIDSETECNVTLLGDVLAFSRSLRWTSRNHGAVGLVLSTRLQICYGLCAGAMPGFEYFGTQYTFEVRSILPAPLSNHSKPMMSMQVKR